MHVCEKERGVERGKDGEREGKRKRERIIKTKGQSSPMQCLWFKYYIKISG